MNNIAMSCQNNQSCQAGKGDKPRNCFSKKYRDNYEQIDWTKNKNEDEKTQYSPTIIDNEL